MPCQWNWNYIWMIKLNYVSDIGNFNSTSPGSQLKIYVCPVRGPWERYIYVCPVRLRGPWERTDHYGSNRPKIQYTVQGMSIMTSAWLWAVFVIGSTIRWTPGPLCIVLEPRKMSENGKLNTIGALISQAIWPGACGRHRSGVQPCNRSPLV